MTAVLVVGSGGREHALAWKLKQSPRVDRIFIAPGNGGTSLVGENVAISETNVDELVSFAGEQEIALTVIGPEVPLSLGLVDRMSSAGLLAFGPTREAARLETSKVFAKQFMARHRIPTADFRVVTDFPAGVRAVRDLGLPVAIKADGLAGGKGVVVCCDVDEADRALHAMLVEGVLGSAAREVVVEQGLIGEEASVLALSDGERVLPLLVAQDHKAAWDGDQGPNTGGMGSCAPAPVLSEGNIDAVRRAVLEPAIAGMKAEGRPYRGILYAGIMLTQRGPQVLEFNVRFGDPETQSILPLLDADLYELLHGCSRGALPRDMLRWRPGACVCVVMASGGYPGNYVKSLPILGLDQASAEPDTFVFHAGTRRTDAGVVTAGGRVLGVTSCAKDVSLAIDGAYRAADHIHFDGMFYRKDIGAKALQRPAVGLNSPLEE